MRNTTCFSGLRPGLVGLALVVALLLLAAPAFAAPQTYTNSIGMEFVLIPAGTFQMGCSSDSEECNGDEKPRHEVTISQAFYLGKYEVTQRQWEAVMGENPSSFKGPDRPVERVSWEKVRKFIRKLNAKEGHKRYRLPTEAEWEYAARAGSTTAYSFGNDKGQLGHYAWYDDNSGDETHPVGQKRPNAWGLHDMHGNVLEWVQDRYGSYSHSGVTDPKGPNTGRNPDRVLRGCCWGSDAGDCRSAIRQKDWPGGWDSIRGLRLVLEREGASEEVRKRAERQVLEAKREQEPLKQAGLAEEKQKQAASTVPTGKTWKNSIGMEFVLIPAGTFQMGCSSDSEGCDDNEKPRHKVRLSKPFYLGKYEVTQRQWEAVMGENPSEFKGPDRPVEMVTWEDVQEFVKRLNAKEGHTRYRLPTEAEWEYAARAGSTTAYSFGNNVTEVHWSDFVLVSYAWYGDSSGKETHPVGQMPPNAWGLHDMHGNVWEWVQDWYSEDAYSAGAVVDPQGPTTGDFRVLRGGSWSSDARDCRSACRIGGEPDDDCDESIGFRLALSPGH